MDPLSRSLKYLNRLFPPSSVTSLTEESYVYELLTDEGSRVDELRHNVDECLELAYRYNLVDADLEARLKKGDRESWEANINELVVARLIEEIFGKGCLHWRPRGQRQKVGEFEIVPNEKDVPVFIEVKTIFARELEKLEQRIMEKLSHCSEQVPVACFLGVQIEALGTSESFSSKKFKNYLVQELSPINPNDLGQNCFNLPDYRDNKTGLHLKIKTLQITPGKEDINCHIGIFGGKVRWLEDEAYIRHSLRKACEQLPSGRQPCLVITCPSTTFALDEDDMLNALFGHLAIRFYRKNDKPVTEPETFRQPDGFFQPGRNRKVSAVGLYKVEKVGKQLEIYHNPFASNPIPEAYVVNIKKGTRQLVRASDTEMRWLE